MPIRMSRCLLVLLLSTLGPPSLAQAYPGSYPSPPKTPPDGSADPGSVYNPEAAGPVVVIDPAGQKPEEQAARDAIDAYSAFAASKPGDSLLASYAALLRRVHSNGKIARHASGSSQTLPDVVYGDGTREFHPPGSRRPEGPEYPDNWIIIPTKHLDGGDYHWSSSCYERAYMMVILTQEAGRSFQGGRLELSYIFLADCDLLFSALATIKKTIEVGEDLVDNGVPAQGNLPSCALTDAEKEKLNGDLNLQRDNQETLEFLISVFCGPM